MSGLFKSKKKLARAKILVVDDDADLVSIIQCRLKWCRCEAVTAADGREGLEKAASERPDLILLDTDMPVMNGHEMLERLRKQPELKDIPVIMLANAWDKDAEKRSRAAGCDDYIQKPVHMAAFAQSVRGYEESVRGKEIQFAESP